MARREASHPLDSDGIGKSPGIVCAFVPARGGSVGLPGKNLMHVGGASLVARAVQCAHAVGIIDCTVVSSDDDAILAEGEARGALAARRPVHLAADDTPMAAVIGAFLDEHPEIATIVLLQPTSPLRIPADVEACLGALETAPAAVTVTKLTHPLSWIFSRTDTNHLSPVFATDVDTRRQQAPPLYELNGAVYAARTDYFRSMGGFLGADTIAVEMPRERSIDVDDLVDLELARTLDALRFSGLRGVHQ